jgi:hypothetical protein
LPRPGSSASLRRAGSGSKRAASSGSAGGEQQQAAQQQQQQPQQAEPPYDRLNDAIAQGPAAEAMQLPKPEPHLQVVSALLEQLMAANPRAFDARAAIGLKVQDRTVMLDNPVGQQASQRKGSGRGSKWTAQLAGKKEQRRLGLYQLQSAGLT